MSPGLRTLWRGAERLGLWAYEYRTLSVATMVFLAVIFFSQSYSPARFVFQFFVLPLAALGLFSPGRRNLGPSYVLVACVIYLAAMLVASWMQPDTTSAQMWHQLRSSAYVVVFVLIVASLVASYPNFTVRFFLFVGTAVAISAAVNIYFFLEHIWPRILRAITQDRLLTTIGMRDYANSTNISATYAVFFIGVMVTVVHGGLSPLLRRALAVAGVVLLAGVLLAQARSALVATTIATAALLLTLSRRTQVISAIGALIIASIVAAVPIIGQAVTRRGSSYRFEVWTKFLDLISERPLLGYGPFSKAGIKLDKGVFLDQAHNLVLSGWFRGGIFAAMAMAFILVGGIYWSGRYWKATGNIAPLCVMITITVAGMVDYQLLPTDPTWPWVTFWLPFGLAAGAEMAWRNTQRRNGKSSPSPGAVPPGGDRPASTPQMEGA